MNVQLTDDLCMFVRYPMICRARVMELWSGNVKSRCVRKIPDDVPC